MSEAKLENKLKLIKKLHKPNTIKDVAADLHVDERTVRRYIAEKEIRIENVKIPFAIQKMKHYEYYSDIENNKDIADNKEYNKSSVHPVVLPLNLTEVYMLTNGILDILGTRHPLYGQYKEIADKIYSQLSDYARTRIVAAKHGLEIKDVVEFISENEMIAEDSLIAIAKAQKGNWEVKATCYNGEIYEGYPIFIGKDLYKLKLNSNTYIIANKNANIDEFNRFLKGNIILGTFLIIFVTFCI